MQAQVNVENIGALDDVDQCVFYYNHAVLLYHQRQYKTALAIMDKLIQFIEPMGKYVHITVMSHEAMASQITRNSSVCSAVYLV